MKLFKLRSFVGILALSLSLNLFVFNTFKANSQQNSALSSNESDSYYENLDLSLNGDDFRRNLSSLITKTHKHQTTYADLKDIFNTTDRNPETNKDMLNFYTGTVVPKYDSNTNNREHLWPKYGGSAFPESTGPGSDAHHLRPCDTQINNVRDTLNFDEVTNGNVAYENGSANYGVDADHRCYYNERFFYPAAGYRGATARILMYVQTRWGYEYGLKFVDGYGTVKNIGKISTLMKWHLTEPVTASERLRNEEVFKIQGNRNPFIDHPEYAYKIYASDGESYNSAIQKVAAQYSSYLDENVNEIKIQFNYKNIAVGEELKLKTKCSPDPGFSFVSWSSSNENVISVDQLGNIKGRIAGKSTITAKYGGKDEISDSIEIEIKKCEAIELIGDPLKRVYEVGEKFDPTGLTVKAYYYDLSENEIELERCKWYDEVSLQEKLPQNTTSIICSYADKSALYRGIVTKNTDDSFRLLTNENDLSDGDQIIIVSREKKVIATKEVNNTYLVKENISIEKNTDYIATIPDNSLILTLKSKNDKWRLINEDGEYLRSSAVKKIGFSNIESTWEISCEGDLTNIYYSDRSCGRILYNSSSPRFTTYTSSPNNAMLVPNVFYRHEKQPTIEAESILLNETEINLLEGEFFQLESTINPSNATLNQFFWETSNKNIAIVDQTGYVTAIKEGEAIITASLLGSDLKAQCKVIVEKPTPTIIDPTPVDPTPIDPTPVDPTPLEPTPVDPTPVDPTPLKPTEPETKNNTAIIVIISVSSLIVVAGIITTIAIIKKKKQK